MNRFNAQSLSNLAYAYALIGYLPNFDDGSDLFDHIAIHANGRTKEFKPQELSNTVWAFAKAGKGHDTLFKAIGDEVVAHAHLRDFRPQALANIVWAYATAGASHLELTEKVASHIVQLDHLRDFRPQNLSNIVWAYATAQVSHPRLFEKMASHIVALDHLGEFKPQELSNTVWAYAKAHLQVSHPGLLEKMAHHIARLDHLRDFKPQTLSNIVWAYATAQVSHPNLFKKVGDHIVALDDLRYLKPQDISNTMWAFAKAQVSHPNLFERFEHHISGLVHTRDFSPQALSNIEWAYYQAVQKEDLFITPIQDTEIFCREDDDDESEYEDLFGSSSPAISSPSSSMEASPSSSIDESNATTLLSPSESEVETPQPCLPNDEDDAASSKHIECKDQKSDEEIITTEDKLNEFSQRVDSACNILSDKFCLQAKRRTRANTISTESYTGCSLEDMIELLRQRREEDNDDSSFHSSDSDTNLSQEPEDDIDEYMCEMNGYEEEKPRFQPPKEFNPFRSRNGSESDSDHDELDSGLDETSVAIKRSAEMTVKNILKDKSRILDKSMSLDVVREMISAKCEGCGRKPEPGTAPNGVDRRFSPFRVYRKDLCDTLCTNCNFSKGTSDPSEWIHTSLRLVQRRRSLLELCRSNEEDFMKSVLHPTHCFYKKKESISATRKGDPQDLESIIPGIVAAIKASNCIYCGCNQGGGIDRVIDDISYVRAGADKQLAPCCSDCNLHKGNWPLFDVLVQAAINVMYLAENYDPSNPVHIANTTPIGGMMSYLSKQRKPIKCTIGGVLIMFPSKRTMQEFYAKIPVGTVMKPVSVLEYKEWRDGLTNEDNKKIRNALDIRPIQDVLRELTEKRDLLIERDEMLRKLDSANDESEVNEVEEEEEEGEEEEEDEVDELFLNDFTTSFSEKKSSALASVDDELDRHSFRTGSRSGSRLTKRDWRLRIEDMNGRLLANVNQKKHALIFLSRRPAEQKVRELAHSDTVVIRIGQGCVKKAMFKISRLQDDTNIGMTKLGRRILHSNEVKYPNGVAITDLKDNPLAVCSGWVKATKLMKSGNKWKFKNFNSKSDKFKVRYITNDDKIGVTELGKDKLPGWTKNFKC
ncbi:hypothetical protein ACHAWC_011890 [Mediolabrus comicus]